jgi:hypothetical protein
MRQFFLHAWYPSSSLQASSPEILNGIWWKVVSEPTLKSSNKLFSFIDVGLLGCNAVWICRYISTFQRSILSPSSGLKVGADQIVEQEIQRIWKLDSRTILWYYKIICLQSEKPQEPKSQQDVSEQGFESGISLIWSRTAKYNTANSDVKTESMPGVQRLTNAFSQILGLRR